NRSVRSASRGIVGLRRIVTKPAQATATLKRLAANLAKSHEMSKSETEAMLGDLVNLVTKHLKKGDRIRIGGLGILVVRKRAARMGRSPATGDVVQIKAREEGLAEVGVVEAKAVSKLLSEELDSEGTHDPAESAYQPSARALALLRGKKISERDLKESGGSYTLQDVESLLGISRQAVDKRVREDALLAVPGPHRRRRYPAVQFTGDGTLPGLAEVLKSLPSANGWFRLNFLIRPDARLDGRRPIDLLKESKIAPVVAAAGAVGVQGA